MPFMPPAPSNPFVTSATIKNDMIELSIDVTDYSAGTYVEISGSATQTSGAFANFYDIQETPTEPNDPKDPEKKRYVFVSAHPLPPNTFRADEDVTVVIRVGRAWLTVLGKGLPGDTSTSGKGARWTRVLRTSQVTDDAQNVTAEAQN
jgi:hypothetical protein